MRRILFLGSFTLSAEVKEIPRGMVGRSELVISTNFGG